MATRDRNIEAVLKSAEDKVITEWGRPAFEKLGSRVQRALLAEAVLVIAASQDDEGVSDEIVRNIVNAGWSWAIERSGY